MAKKSKTKTQLLAGLARAEHARQARKRPPRIEQIESEPDVDIRVLTKQDVCELCKLTFPTIHNLMREKRFPLSHQMGGKSIWFEHEIKNWLRQLPLSVFKEPDLKKSA